MSSLADLSDLIGFFSYSRQDDEDSSGKLSKLRERIQAELRGQLGRAKTDFKLWQDKDAIAQGELWEDRIKAAVGESVFFIPIITPTAVKSYHCKFEFNAFLSREKELGRSNLVFPILYIPVPALSDGRWHQDPLLKIIGSRQYEDWQNWRHLDPSSSPEFAQRIDKFCANISRALHQPWLSPEERQEAESRQRGDEEERRCQEKLRQARQRDEEQRRLEEERRWAAKEEQRRQTSEKEAQHAPPAAFAAGTAAHDRWQFAGAAAVLLLVVFIGLYHAGVPTWVPRLGADMVIGANNEIERSIAQIQFETIQANLCVVPTGRFDGDTREAIRQAKIGARQSRLAASAPPFTNIENEIKSLTEAQTFLGARGCKDNSLGWATAFEKFRFPDRAAIKDLSRQLRGCDRGLQESESFDQAMRAAIRAIKARAPDAEKQNFGDPNSNTLNDKSYAHISVNCVP